MSINYFWPTPIYVCDFDSNIDYFNNIQNEISTFVEMNKNSLTKAWPHDNMLSNFIRHGNKPENCLEKMTNLLIYIRKHVSQFTGLHHSRLNIYESWINFGKQYSYQSIHNHSPADISGVYYYMTNCLDGNIVFNCESTGLKTSKWINVNSQIPISPKNGKLILFPSYLEHFVEMNETDSERISLSFNLMVT
jgi:uncharacterized protein (TIGR02466 family)